MIRIKLTLNVLGSSCSIPYIPYMPYIVHTNLSKLDTGYTLKRGKRLDVIKQYVKYYI